MPLNTVMYAHLYNVCLNMLILPRLSLYPRVERENIYKVYKLFKAYKLYIVGAA